MLINSLCFSGERTLLRYPSLRHPCRSVTLRFRVENNSPCFSGAIIFAMIEEHVYVERIVL